MTWCEMVGLCMIDVEVIVIADTYGCSRGGDGGGG
jgi:hypothetical protein